MTVQHHTQVSEFQSKSDPIAIQVEYAACKYCNVDADADTGTANKSDDFGLFRSRLIELSARDACCAFTSFTACTHTIIIMSYERRRRRRGEIAVLGPSATTLNTVQMTTTTMTTGEKLQSPQTRSLRPPSSNLAKWLVLLCLGLAHLTVMARRT
jgi:hypothetical protein